MSHLCLFAFLSPEHINQTLDEKKGADRGLFFVVFDESLNRAKTEGVVKEKNTMACNPVPPPVLPENTLVLHHVDRGANS